MLSGRLRPGSDGAAVSLRFERDDARRMGVDAEIKGQLPRARRLQIAQDRAEGDAALLLVVNLAHQRKAAEVVKGIGVVLEGRPDEAPFLQVAKVVLAQRGVHRQDVALAVMFLAQVGDRRQTDTAAELVLAEQANLSGLFGVELGGAPELLAVRAGVVNQPRQVRHPLRIRLAADHQQRRPLRHIVVRRSTEALDDRARLLAAKRPQLSGKHQPLTRQAGTRTTVFVHGVPTLCSFRYVH